MVFPNRAWRRFCAISVLVCIAAVNFAIAHPTATFAWTPTTPQVSAATFGGTSTDYATAVAVDASGNVYTAGFFNGTVDFDSGVGTSNLTSAGGSDVFISKLDSSGNFVWAKSFGTNINDDVTAVAVDASGNVYTAGFFNGTADFDPGVGTSNLTSAGTDVFISKLDSLGNFVWAKKLGGISTDNADAVAVDASGNVYTTGYFTGTADFDPGVGTSNLTSAGIEDVFISKLDSLGNLVWARGIGGTATDRAYAVAVDASGNVYTTGYFTGTADFDPGVGTSNLTSAGLQDVFISKLDSLGNFVWARGLGGTATDRAYAVAVDASGNVHTTGEFQGTADFDPGVGTLNLTSVANADVFISKLDSLGNFVWAKRLGFTSTDIAHAVAVDASGNVYTTGYFSGTVDFNPGVGISNLTSVGSFDVFILKLDSLGNFVWARGLGGTAVDRADAAAVDASGNVYTAGYFNGTVDFDPGVGISNLTSAGSADGFVLKLDSSGANNLITPTVSWTEPSSPSSSRTLSYTLVFNTSVTGIAADDFSNTGTATGCVFTPSGSSGSSVTVSVVCASDGTVVARIAADAVTASGMTGPVSGVSASSVSIDTVPTPTTTTAPSPTTTVPRTTTTTISNATTTTAPSPTTTVPRTTTTTISNATTTTVAPSPVVTVAVGQISIATIAPSLPGAKTTTTTTSPARAFISPTLNPTSTVQSTIPVPIATVAPAQPATTLAPIDVPTIPRGGSALIIAGKEVPLEITRIDNQLLLNAQNFDAAFSGVRTDGTVIPLDTDGNIRLDKGDAIKVTVTGFAPESQVEIRLYSDPILLGMATVDDEGTVTQAYQIPESVPAGSHRVVLAGKNYSGDKVVFTVGIVLEAQESASGLVRVLIAIPILVAIFLALFLPAFLRRRKKTATI